MKRTPRQRSDYVRYRLQLARERAALAITGLTPYEQAVRTVESQTGESRSTWEHKLNHDNTLEANRIARDIAGIPELPISVQRTDAVQPRRRKVA